MEHNVRERIKNSALGNTTTPEASDDRDPDVEMRSVNMPSSHPHLHHPLLHLRQPFQVPLYRQEFHLGTQVQFTSKEQMEGLLRK